MIPSLWMLFWTLFLQIFKYQSIECSSCIISNLDKIDGYCAARIDCQEKLNFDVETWSCIKHTRRERYYDYGYRYREVASYDETYFLSIYIKEPVQYDSLLLNENHIIKLTMEDGDLVAVPEDIFKMNILSELNLSGNKISIVNLNNFLSLYDLKEVILKNNMIRIIETNAALRQLKISSIEILDMSNNKLHSLPNNFVSSFVQLQHLNLSRNMIRSVGLLTFEGIVKLKTLDLSYNRLSEIGHALARFSNLKELSISHNNITELLEYSFATLTNLEKLNASFNCIATINNNTFQVLTMLKDLDLSHNCLKIISKQFFASSIHLSSLLVSNNEIQHIDENSFLNTILITFSVENNSLVGTLKNKTFKGVNTLELNLSGGNLTSIESEAFVDMFLLSVLNISSNCISNIAFSSFSSLLSLNKLDLSYNEIREFNFDSRSLKNLTELFIHHNKIGNITKNVFENLLSLKELDLSYNDIKQIEPRAISKLSNVIFLTVKNSNFVSTLERKVLEGLTSLIKIDMSQTKTMVFQNESFSGLTSLTDINYTFGQLMEIEYNAFLGLGILKKLCLSNNQLQQFYVNTSTISGIHEIYLNNNYLRTISSQTFSNLTFLRVLNLTYNEIIKLDFDGFQDLKVLTHLDLSSNTKMKIVGNPFQNLSRLYSLSLENVTWNTSFANSSASTEILNLKSCDISNVNIIHIFNVQGLSSLYLSMNKITTIDKHSFRNINTLVTLDLSLNKIIYIQPGSFLYLKNLRILNLYNNRLPSVQYGALDGIEVLAELNLSNNVLSNFDVKLLPNTEKLFLDNNAIVDINLEDFLDSELSKLSLGGNPISCKALAKLESSKYYEKFKSIVTAKNLDYHSENVDGISCQTVINAMPANNNSHIENNPSINLHPLIVTLQNVLDKVNQLLQVVSENTNASNILKDEGENITKLLEDVIKVKNSSEIANKHNLELLNQFNNDSYKYLYKYLSKITNINNDSNIQLSEMKKYLIQLVHNKNGLNSNSTQETNSLVVDQYLRLEFKKMIKEENDALREEFKNALAGIANNRPIQQSLIAHEKGLDDSKTIIYFIAVCSAIMLSVYIGNILFKHIISSRRSYNYCTRNNSTTRITNSMEME